MMDLGRYFSNPSGAVSTVRNLPEEVVAALFARYSRSPLGIRQELASMLDEQGGLGADGAGHGGSLDEAVRRSSKFHEKFVVGYGHSSVAEHATVHLAVEGCSILAAKRIEDRRLGSYTEKSTRYVRFDADGYVADVGFSGAHAQAYRSSCERLLEAYELVCAEAEREIARRRPDVSAAAVRARACDLSRGLLPASARTNVGVTMNARSLAHSLRSMREVGAAELDRLADAIEVEASRELPTLLRYVEPSSHRAAAWQRVGRAIERTFGPAAPGRRPIEPAAGPEVRLHSRHGTSAREIAWSVMAEVGTILPPGDGLTAVAPWPDDRQALEIVEAYMAGRGRHEQPDRALERAFFTWEVTCDYGAWRDLARHRMASATLPTLGVGLGYVRPDGLRELGLAEAFDSAVVQAGEVARELAGVNPWLAQYAVPLAFRVSYALTVNLREAFHLVELRSSSAGHPGYRAVAHALARDVISACPWTEGHLRVDWADHEFAREPRKP